MQRPPDPSMANEIDFKKKRLFTVDLNQLSNFMILIPYPGGNCLRIMGDLTDTNIILIIIVVNAAIGFVQEYRAEKQWKPLKI
jgi:Ca2+-transporting ATPase